MPTLSATKTDLSPGETADVSVDGLVDTQETFSLYRNSDNTKVDELTLNVSEDVGLQGDPDIEYYVAVSAGLSVVESSPNVFTITAL